jgi:hypothetical protein
LAEDEKGERENPSRVSPSSEGDRGFESRPGRLKILYLDRRGKTLPPLTGIRQAARTPP